MTHVQRFLLYISIVLVPLQPMVYAHSQVQTQKDPVLVCIQTMPYTSIRELHCQTFPSEHSDKNDTEISTKDTYTTAINYIMQRLTTADTKYAKKIRKAIQKSYHAYDLTTEETLAGGILLPIALIGLFVLVKYKWDRIQKVNAERAQLAKSLNFNIEDWCTSLTVNK